MLSRESILGHDDLKREELPIPEWGGSVFVRTLTASERDQFEDRVLADKKTTKRDIRALLAVASVCDEQGKPLFTPADVPQLGRKSAAALDRIFDVAMRLSRIGKQDVEELEKNSSGTPSESSPSDSPFGSA